MIITLTGKPCSGKSTVAKILVEKYGFSRIGIGDMFKAEAHKRGMSAEEFTKFRVSDPSFDIYMDKQIPVFLKEQKSDKIVLESRVAWHFLDDSFDVFVDVSDKEMARRLANSDRTGKEKYSNFEDALKTTTTRWAMELEVYKKTYNIDCSDFSNYDYVVDSSNFTAEEVADKIYQKALHFFKK